MDTDTARAVTSTSTGDVVIPISNPEPFQTEAQRPSWFGTCWRILHHVHVGTLLVIYTSLVGLVQLKFQSTKESAFETHSLFMFMSVAAIILFSLTFWVLDYTNENHLSSPTLLQKILVSVAFFSILVALVSLVLVLLLPPNLMWIGYSMICLIVIAIIAYTSIHHLSSLGRNMYMVIWKLFNYIKDKYSHLSRDI